jgi:DNA topoisomerase-1
MPEEQFPISENDEIVHADVLADPDADNFSRAMSRVRALALGFTKEEADRYYGNPKIGISDDSVCFECAHYEGGQVCKAFPFGIPPTILLAYEDHFKPYAGDHGIQFKLAEIPRVVKGGAGSGDLPGHEFRGNQWTEGQAGWDADSKSWKDREGNELPEHIKGLKIPPGWENIRYNKNPDGDLLVTAGPKKVIYSARFTAQQAEAKYARIKELSSRFDEIKQSVDADIAAGRNVEEAACLRMVMNTGLRPGGSSDAIGATTLQGRNVVELQRGLRLRFVGKSSAENDILVTDPEVVKDLLARKAAAGSRGLLFDTTAAKLSDYSHSKGDFNTKDYRTLLGTKIAQTEIAKIRRLPRDEKTYKKLTIKVAKNVAEKLGNTWRVCLQSYIHPSVFSRLRMNAMAT